MIPDSSNVRKAGTSRLFVAWSHISTKAIILSFAIFILTLNLLFFASSVADTHSISPRPPATDAPASNSPASVTCDTPATTEHRYIPNHVHFVFVLSDPEKDFSFQFKHFLSMYAAWYYWKPDVIYLHTNADEQGQAITRAREGQSGKWNKLIFNMFDNLRINTVEAPTHTNTGKEIQGMEHRSDFVRVKQVHELGGVYIDFDVHALRDIRILRESGFKAIAGRQLGGQINSGIFMSVKGGKMVERWMHGMHTAYTGGWTTHSNEVITKFGQRLVREPGEMLIMERDAFAPGSWENDDTDKLFAPHDDVLSNFANATDTSPLPTYDEAFDERWETPGDFPDWARDWSSTYLLHAFTAARWGHKVPNFEKITPLYVLERRSNFARAVYPVVRQMHEDGLFDVDDLS
ncbi:uncharacterized protein F5Z01DRAFT_657187 [Emericellopsis atlantica]|uniref:Glycosyl transferase n=1 Tax=Emericellopsis atlantica TaxID=2614577 RepID=A0A9P7ZKM7_9HYPO|nr:uncharacterized protein F5Z01DRAFT_657187 [Emericellopsis atlantica]KAG9253427.1 hypothetical protein F5Z01DRAFT_657187 [Emericellopsis atlantica]